ncbi:odorant receptor 94a-like [Microplitis demolitor]|uniref:odorant receptor 94a-like n=1 Tax=Microplitis demolitor TaxID=69319 RepID=UPI0006D4DC09|nr:odorant receptor 94a-like [Microplitis demolitor]
MAILERNIFFLTLVGLWKPEHWKGFKAALYYFYIGLLTIVNHSFLLSGVLDFELRNIDAVVIFDNLSLLSCLITVRYKIVTVLYYRKSIEEFVNRFERDPFKAKDDEEEKIYIKFGKFTKTISILYTGLCTVGASWYSLGRILRMTPPDVMPYQGWFPYNYTTYKYYWPTAIYQLYAVCSAACVNFAYDTIFCSILYYLCAQTHILKYRFSVLVENLQKINEGNDGSVNVREIERKMIGNWVDYHNDVLSLVEFVKSLFSTAIFVQYAASSLLICSITYTLSHTETRSINFVGTSMYVTAMTIQIFFQCIAANQVTVEFADITNALYSTNWYNLSNNVQKSMTIILAEPLKPTLISSGYFVILSLESFTKVIKLSYTIYNVIE